jgi:hypothetical protein
MIGLMQTGGFRRPSSPRGEAMRAARRVRWGEVGKRLRWMLYGAVLTFAFLVALGLAL